MARTLEQLNGIRLGDMTPEERKMVTTAACQRLDAELRANAPAIAKVLDGFVPTPSPARAPLSGHALSERRTPNAIVLRCSCGWHREITRHQNALARAAKVRAALREHLASLTPGTPESLTDALAEPDHHCDRGPTCRFVTCLRCGDPDYCTTHHRCGTCYFEGD